ncbi:MAG: M48 family metallopeptidase [Prochlorothrix sp.]
MVSYPGLASDAFRHPLDQEAEQALRSVPGFELVARKFIELLYERPQLVYLMGNAIQVGPNQYSTLHRLFQECVVCLDVDPVPQLFVSQNPAVNSYALGEENPYIVVYSGLLDLLTEAEIRAVLAHELGHIKCGHTTLTQMAIWVMNTASIVGEFTLGLGNLVSTSLVMAFYEWRRKAELSADRASLLGTDDLDTVLSTLMKLAGGSQRYGGELTLSAFRKQSMAYQDLDEDGLNTLYKALFYSGGTDLMMTHPFPVDRVTYLEEWATSGAYQRIRQGTYPRKSTAATAATAPPSSASARPQAATTSPPRSAATSSNAKPSVHSTPTPSSSSSAEIEQLRQEIHALQAELARRKGQGSPQS